MSIHERILAELGVVADRFTFNFRAILTPHALSLPWWAVHQWSLRGLRERVAPSMRNSWRRWRGILLWSRIGLGVDAKCDQHFSLDLDFFLLLRIYSFVSGAAWSPEPHPSAASAAGVSRGHHASWPTGVGHRGMWECWDDCSVSWGVVSRVCGEEGCYGCCGELQGRYLRCYLYEFDISTPFTECDIFDFENLSLICHWVWFLWFWETEFDIVSIHWLWYTGFDILSFVIMLSCYTRFLL